MLSRLRQSESRREQSRSRAYDAIRRERQITRPALAQLIGLSRATASVIADELIESGLVSERGPGESSGGRPPMVLEFDPNAAFALGARMYDRNWGIVITNLDAQVVHRLEKHIPDNTPETAVRALQEGVAEITQQLGGKKLLPAIGVGTPGLVDVQAGVIRLAADVNWYDIPMRAMLEEALQYRVYMANRSKVGALAEAWYGAKRGIQNLIYVSIGTGVSAGIVSQGQLIVGTNSSAGELGHVTVVPDGPLCPCGNRGCLQQLVAGPAVANQARMRLRTWGPSLLRTLVDNHPDMITIDTVFEAAAQQDQLALELVGEMAAHLGLALATLVNLLNPQLIVLGGPVGHRSQVLLDPLLQAIHQRVMAFPMSVVRLVTSTLEPDTGAIGASVLVLQQVNDLLFRGE